MANLTTSYLGLNLQSPIVISSNPLSEDIDSIRQLEEAGAGAIVLFSLFEEQIEMDELGYSGYYDNHRRELPEALRHVPAMKEYHMGAGGYLAHIYQVKRAVQMPIIASLNGYYSSGWTRYAKLIEAAGADALELNIYYVPTKAHVSGADVEQMYIDLVRNVRQVVRIPVAVKISSEFSSIANFSRKLVGAGADALVLFNRFYQPDIDLDTETIAPTIELSNPSELRLRLRWVALLAGQLDAQLAITGGVHSGGDVAKSLLAGANVAMMASAVLRHGPGYVATVLNELTDWLEEHGYEDSNSVRGKLCQLQTGDTAALERANYLNIMLSHRSWPDADE
ncbi:MAG: dihydroorotate dehydrogenase-like protein [Chloroflexota bacterium]